MDEVADIVSKIEESAVVKRIENPWERKREIERDGKRGGTKGTSKTEDDRAEKRRNDEYVLLMPHRKAWGANCPLFRFQAIKPLRASFASPQERINQRSPTEKKKEKALPSPNLYAVVRKKERSVLFVFFLISDLPFLACLCRYCQMVSRHPGHADWTASHSP